MANKIGSRTSGMSNENVDTGSGKFVRIVHKVSAAKSRFVGVARIFSLLP